jgi:hypothetical protein
MSLLVDDADDLRRPIPTGGTAKGGMLGDGGVWGVIVAVLVDT